MNRMEIRTAFLNNNHNIIINNIMYIQQRGCPKRKNLYIGRLLNMHLFFETLPLHFIFHNIHVIYK